MESQLLPGEPRRLITLAPDYGTDWPVWESSSRWRDADDRPAENAISAELAALLRDWYDLWEMEFSPTRTWSSRRSEDPWLTQGEALAERLRAEIGDWADVEYDARAY